MEIIIDNRENKLKNHFKNKNYVKFSNLDLGDIIFKFNNEIVLIVERKTLQDLSDSIKDGRYREQKLRLLGNYPKDKILYLIEGNMNRSKNISISGLKLYGLFSCLINLLLRDKIKIYKTNNITETIRFIQNLSKKIKLQGNSFMEKSQIQYCETLKIKKKSNLTPHVCFLYQLSQIPGISHKMASVISEKYPSMFELIKCYLSEKENKETLLSDLKIKLKNGKKRRIGDKASKNIYLYLSHVISDSS